MNGEFIILYGWSNPQIIEGFNSTPPPILLPSILAHPGEREMMIIPLDNMDTGGYWSAAKLNVTSYDFSFNEMGQLEINVGFMDKTSMMMNSVRVGSIASTFKKIMSRGDFDPTAGTDIVEDVGAMWVTLPGGIRIQMAELIANDQAAMSRKTGSTPTGPAPPGVENLHDRLASSFIEMMDGEEDSDKVAFYATKGENNQEAYWAEVKRRERRGFPWGGPGIRSYEKVTVRKRRVDDPTVTVSTEAGDDDETDSGDASDATEEITSYRVKVVYYYLGWVLEALRLSLVDQNRSRVREGDTSFNPKFKYLKNESTSKLKSAFQQKVSQTERRGSTTEKIQNAIIRLKENCLPPFLMAEDLNIRDIQWDPDNPIDQLGLYKGRRQDGTHRPCAGRVIAEGVGDDGNNKNAEADRERAQKIADKIFPTPEENVEGSLLPMRGHRVLIDPGDDQYAHVGLTNKQKDEDPFWVFKPDWKQRDVIIEDTTELGSDGELQISLNLGYTVGERNRARAEAQADPMARKINVIPAGGSPEGYDPLNPTAYKAADRGGRFFYAVSLPLRQKEKVMKRHRIFIMEVDQFRKSDNEIWQLTQRKWHGMYVQYLGNYFEQLIKNRVAELEKEGRTVEDIYNEPIDLDFLTGKVFNNLLMAQDTRTRNDAMPASGPEHRVDGLHEAPSRWTYASWARVRQSAGGESSAAGMLAASIDKTEIALNDNIRALEVEEIARDKLLELVIEKQNNNNTIKRRTEELTGGIYEAGRDATENEMLINFKNWKQIGQGKLLLNPGGAYYKKIDLYEDNIQLPEVKLEWMIWKKYGVPTDNWFNEPSDKNGENLQSKWKFKNPDQLRQLQDEIEPQQRIVDINISLIMENDRVLKDDNNKYLDTLENITTLESNVDTLTARLTRYSSYINEDDEEDNMRELSPYDDTSEFDVPLPVDMGRDKPMVLTTRVAQQWYRRFSVDIDSTDGPARMKQGRTVTTWDRGFINGVTDVTNYGPQTKGGTKYYLPGGVRQFTFDSSRRNKPAVGFPHVILDKEACLEAQRVRGYRSLYITENATDDGQSWRQFGHPAANPDTPGTNAFGYFPGPRIIDENGINTGGNHVADYTEFLALFGLTAPQKILQKWPWPTGIRNSDPGKIWHDDEFYYMVDDANNIIRMAGSVGAERQSFDNIQGKLTGKQHGIGHQLRVPDGYTPEELANTFVQTGWYLGYGGDPVYLYPSAATAVQMKLDDNGKKVITKKNNLDTNWPKKRTDAEKKKGGTAEDRMGKEDEGHRNDRYYGAHYRIGANQHNINLTLDEKRALVLPLARSWPIMSAADGGDNPVPYYLGYRGATKGPSGGLFPIGFDVSRLGAAAPKQPETEGGLHRIYYEEDGQRQSRKVNRTIPYTNPSWPYGTGYYRWDYDGGIPGAHKMPKKGARSGHYVKMGDFIEQLPNHGFFTTVNNDNHSPSVIAQDGKIINGKQLNVGFVEFILHNVYAPLGLNRRTAIRGNGNGRPRGELKISYDSHDRNRLNDTTYGHLFRPIDDDEEDNSDSGGISFTDFGLKDVESVADMPIRRDVVDNLMNKNNVNMSLAQFVQELIHPSSIGINTGNIHVSIRQKPAGNFEVFQATKNWQAKADEVNAESNKKEILFKHKFPEKHFLIDYKQQDSLIENIDMSSKFDPAIALTFERGAQAFAGNPTAIVKFLSYGEVATDLKEFLDNEDKVNNTTMYAKVFNDIGTGPTGKAAEIIIAQNAFFDTPKDNGKKIVSDSVMTRFLMQRPERMNKLNAMLQAEPGSNFATQLLSHYMRRCTITIHGTTNITPFNSINISGVLPNLEGLYLITSVRESIQTQNFQTIIEGVLLRPRQIENMETHKYTLKE